MRIVSLLASGTEIVHALGLGERLVGISHECDFPPEALDRPRVSRPRFDPRGLDSAAIDAAVRRAMAQHGSVYTVDVDQLRSLQPDLILTQAVCDVCAVPTSLAEQAADVLDRRALVLSLDAHTVADVLRTIRQVGEAAGAVHRAHEVVGQLEARMAAVVNRVAGAPRPRVLALEWLAPPFAPGHWTPEMVSLAGGEPLVGDPGRPSREVSWDELDDADPDVLIIMPCGYGLAEAQVDADAHAERLLAVAGRAVDQHRAYVVDGSAYFNRSGPRIVDGIEILGALLHPRRVPQGHIIGRVAGWKPGHGALSESPAGGPAD